MDAGTIAAYDRAAKAFADDWHGQDAPTDMQRLLRRYFAPGPTADIGCGSGRDVAWLAAQGFDVVGYDPSAGLIAEARRRYPALRFALAALPGLDGIADASFANLLCETVLMHLPPGELGATLDALMRVLRPRGTLYLSWRVVSADGERDGHGRLYAAIDAGRVVAALGASRILMDEAAVSASSGKPIHRIIARK